MKSGGTELSYVFFWGFYCRFVDYLFSPSFLHSACTLRQYFKPGNRWLGGFRTIAATNMGRGGLLCLHHLSRWISGNSVAWVASLAVVAPLCAVNNLRYHRPLNAIAPEVVGYRLWLIELPLWECWRRSRSPEVGVPCSPREG